MNINSLLKKEIEKIKISENEFKEIEKLGNIIKKQIKKEISRSKIKADIFIGGSLAKKTLMKKEEYDIDIFVRFSCEYKDEELSDILEKLLKQFNCERIHGSRDYFKIKRNKITFEIVPSVKISKPRQARNVTDLSYFHVSYVRKCISKNKKLINEILLAKAFCHANNFYGAESYIKGFSGYALELLICHYKSFVRFLKEAVKREKIIILSKQYKNKKDVLLEMNEAKLSSPIILVDPTFKERNALAALSNETYSRFREIAGRFLKKPSESFFQATKPNEKNFNLIIKAKTSKQAGDIAGSKLLKFNNYIERAIEKYFKVKKKEFFYDNKQEAKFYFKIEKRKEIILSGPMINAVEHVSRFKKKHKNCFIKNYKVYAREKVNINIQDVLNSREMKKVMSDMGIKKIELLKLS